MDEALAQSEAPTLDVLVVRPIVEEQVLELLYGVVKGLDGCEVPIDHVVEQTMHERFDAEPGEVAVVVPPLEQFWDGERAVLFHGDQGPVVRPCPYRWSADFASTAAVRALPLLLVALGVLAREVPEVLSVDLDVVCASARATAVDVQVRLGPAGGSPQAPPRQLRSRW